MQITNTFNTDSKKTKFKEYGVNNPILFRRANQIRQSYTPAERNLWQEIRPRKMPECDFRRHYPIGHYIVDFCCEKTKTIIEIENEFMSNSDFEASQLKERKLKSLGFSILKFTSHEVMTRKEHVLYQLKNVISKKDCARTAFSEMVNFA